LTNAFVLAGQSVSVETVDTEGVPDDLRGVLQGVLRHARLLDRNNSFIAGLAPLTDEANRWSRLGTPVQIIFRERTLQTLPGAVLVN
jgi:hypothetical protein